jgi:RNA polymerase sigma factor for flagellar operon FliA
MATVTTTATTTATTDTTTVTTSAATGVDASRAAELSDIHDLWLQFKADPDNQDLRNRLVEQYLPLVKYNGERIWARLPEGVELDDLVSAGIFGLMDAIDAFDLSRGVKFETYCVPRIRGAMLDELRTMDWVPRLVRSKASKLNEAMKTLEARLGRQPSEQELAEHMQISLAELEKMVLDASAVNLISLNKKWYETDSYKDVREIDILEDKKGEDPTRRIQKNDLMRLVTKGLNRNERLIIILYYYEELTMKEIGATLDLSESRVSQMHSSIMQRLQGQLGRRRPEFAT